ncbi:hypothetical protein EBS40_02760 [bacterium]|nr:hypothetical protein [bacterium]
MSLFVSNISYYKKDKQLILTQITDNQFLIEGEFNKVKIGGENEYSISYMDFECGPFIHIGKDFLGRGRVTNIDLIDQDNPNYIIVKVKLDNE